MPVSFFSADVPFKLSGKRLYISFLTQQVKKECNKKLRLSYIFCSDSYLLNLNRQYLKHDYYTDVITFPISDTEGLIDAEIYISTESVAANARRYKAPFAEELARVMFHGVLHLIGYKDKSAKAQKKMRQMENQWLSEFNQTKPK
jgi:rRNA maturation RNase YbeY